MGESSIRLHLGAVDGLRALACLLIAGFHAQWWMAQLVRDQEATETHVSLILGGTFIVVDIFFAITGFLTARSLFRHSIVLTSVFDVCDRSSACCSGWYANTRRRFWRIMPPLAVVLGAAAVAFGPHDQTWPRVYLRSETNQAISELFAPSLEYQGGGLAWWWTHLVHVSSLAPVGGFLMHGWSLSVQYLWFLTFPAVWAVLGLSKGSRLAWFVGLCAVGHAAMRLWMWQTLAAYPLPSPMAKFAQFSFYTSAAARIFPCALGAAVAWLLERELATVHWLRHDVGAAATATRVLATSSVIVVGGLNVVWEHTHGHPGGGGPAWQQGAAYTLCHPGGLLTAVAMAWLLLAAVADVPLLWPPHASSVSRKSDTVASSVPLSMFTRAMLWRAWLPLSAASYWFYLLHPAVFSLAMPRPHFLLPVSQARVPVPPGYGLAVTPADYSMQLQPRSPLHPHSVPTIAAVTNAGLQAGWVPPYQAHWLVDEAVRAGLAEAPRVSQLARLTDMGAVMGGLVLVSALLALGLRSALELPSGRAVRAAPAWLLGAVSWAVDAYHGVLLVALPLAHVSVNAVWLLFLNAAAEAGTERALRAAGQNASIAALAEHSAYDLRWRQ